MHVDVIRAHFMLNIPPMLDTKSIYYGLFLFKNKIHIFIVNNMNNDSMKIPLNPPKFNTRVTNQIANKGDLPWPYVRYIWNMYGSWLYACTAAETLCVL